MALVLLGGICTTSSMALSQTELLFSPLWATARDPAKGLTLLPPQGKTQRPKPSSPLGIHASPQIPVAYFFPLQALFKPKPRHCAYVGNK